MRYSNRLKFIVVFLVLITVGIIVYQIPWVNQRLAWRFDIAQTYLRGIVQPAGGVPTSKPNSRSEIVPTIIPIRPTTSPLPSTSTATPSYTARGETDSQEQIPSALPTQEVTPTFIPESVTLPPPEWEKQDWNNCGPATLSMYLNYYGWEGDQFDVSSVLKPTREDRNVNVEELVYFSRNYAGWLHTEYRVGGDINLLKKFIAAEIPVMIEATFTFEGAYWPNDDLWAAHYLLITAYDDLQGKFTVQDSFHGPNQIINYQTLDKNWYPFNRVYILIYTASQEDIVKGLLGSAWDEVHNREQTLEDSRKEVAENPKDAFSWFNLGTNLIYFEQYQDAAEAYDQARSIGWPQRMLRYQFGPFFAYFHSGRTEDLLALTEYALQRTPNSEEALLWHGWALYRQGDILGASEDFQAALKANYRYQDAQYALDYISGR
jgi:tetratricopeptide (TPR) repeat protein